MSQVAVVLITIVLAQAIVTTVDVTKIVQTTMTVVVQVTNVWTTSAQVKPHVHQHPLLVPPLVVPVTMTPIASLVLDHPPVFKTATGLTATVHLVVVTTTIVAMAAIVDSSIKQQESAHALTHAPTPMNVLVKAMPVATLITTTKPNVVPPQQVHLLSAQHVRL